MKPDKSRVIRYDLETKEILQIFDSSKAASIYLDIKASNVSLCINNKLGMSTYHFTQQSHPTLPALDFVAVINIYDQGRY